MRNRRLASRALGLAAFAATLALTACTSTSPGGEDGAAEAAPLPTAEPTDPAAVATSETVTPTTVAPATTVPPTTAAPVVTEAPTTLAPPPPPPSTLPASYEPIAPVDVPLAAVGSGGGAETARVQQRLLDLGFWLEGVDGSYGLTTRQAVMAFQKYVGLPADGSVDGETAAQLSAQAEQSHATADAGTLVEVDKSRQLLFMVVDGRTQWIFNTSTANGQPYEEEDQNTPGEIQKGVAITPDGLHKVNRERPEGWWEGDLGQIYRPKYFVGGVAVHGSNSVPNYPASHGCVRVTVQAMDYIWEAGLMPMNIPVWVHGTPPV